MVAARPALKAGMFEIERCGETIIVVPTVDLREFDFQRIEDGAGQILHLLNGTGVKNIVLDFSKTDYYGSTALGFFVKLWKKVRQQNGRMSFCNISEHETEILRITHLDHLWPVFSERHDAVEAVKS
jgi:anti-sigma B factor antagonist